MRRMAIGVLLCSLALLACGSPELDAHNRVTMMLDGWQRGDMEEAVCRWYKGTRQLQLDHLKHAQGKFEVWRREASLYGKINSWAITDITQESGSNPPAMIVSVDIDGRGYRMRVPVDLPMEWVR